MKSGNPQRVAAALDKARSTLSSAAEDSGLESTDPGVDPGSGNLVLIFIAIAAVVVAVALYQDVTGTNGSYARDAYMLDLSQRFAPSDAL